MATVNIGTTIRCPYIPQHVMHIESLLTHLNRCKATNKHLFKSCLYNSLHVIPKQHYKQHIQNCQDAAKFRQQNEQTSWQEKDKKKCLYISFSNKTESHNSSSHSEEQQWYDDSSDQDEGYGYYDYINQHDFSLGDKLHEDQYDPVQAQHHSASFFKDRYLNYLNPASMTIPKKQTKIKKKVNTTTHENNEEQRFKQRNLNKNVPNLFKKSVLVSSQRDTLEETQSEPKGKKLNEDDDTQILMFLNQFDTKTKKFNVHDQTDDQLGNALIEQVNLMKNKRTYPINYNDNTLLSMK